MAVAETMFLTLLLLFSTLTLFLMPIADHLYTMFACHAKCFLSNVKAKSM